MKEKDGEIGFAKRGSSQAAGQKAREARQGWWKESHKHCGLKQSAFICIFFAAEKQITPALP